MSELQTFFDGLDKDNSNEKPFDVSDLFAKKESPQEEEVTKDTEETVPVEENVPFAKNPKLEKYIQRQAKKLVQEELSKMGTPSEVETFKKEVASDYGSTPSLKWLNAYGDNEQSRLAWEIHKEDLAEAEAKAEQRALSKFQESLQEEKQAQKQFESYISDSLENLEDEYGIDLTSNSPKAKKERSEFLDLVGKLSPKDSEGNVTGYADFNEAFNIYQSIKVKQAPSEVTNEKKQLASRSMAKSTDVASKQPIGEMKPLSFGESITDMLFK